MILNWTNKYKKDLKKIDKQGKNIGILEAVVKNLLNGKKLGLEYKDHQLKGRLKEYRECHLSGNWLLMYKIKDDCLLLFRTGSHPEVFDNY